MRKRGFYMYTAKGKQIGSIYNYKPKYSNHQEAEIQVHIARKASKDIARSIDSSIKRMTTDISRSFVAKERY